MIEISPFAAGVAALVVVTLLVYSNSLRGPFVFDDELNIVENPIVHDLSYFAAPWKVDEAVAPNALVYGFRSRYLPFLTLALNYRLHGARVFGYHLVNLAIHVAAGLTLFAAIRHLLLLERFDASRLRGRETLVALLVAGLFALHPLQTQAVTYIVQRMASLAGLFCLVGLWFYLAARTSERPIERRLFAVGYGAALVAAAASKQSSVTFPLVAVLVEVCIFGSGARARARWLAYSLALLVALPLVGVQILRSNAPHEPERIAEIAAADFGVREYVLTQIPVLVTYLRLTILPIGQNLDYDFPVARSPFEPWVLGCAAVLAALCALGVWLLADRDGRDPAWRLVGLGILWFFVMHMVESSGVGLLDFIFEHRMYLPSIGLFLAAVVALAVGLPPRRAPAGLAAVAAAALVLGAVTHARNEVWRTELRLYRDIVAKSPRKPRALVALGEALLELKRVDEAERLFLRAYEIDPRRVEVLVHLGVVARVKRDPERAERLLRQAIAISPDHWVARVNLGDLALARGDRQEAEANYRRAVAHEQLSRIARGKLERLRSGQEPLGSPPQASSATGSRRPA